MNSQSFPASATLWAIASVALCVSLGAMAQTPAPGSGDQFAPYLLFFHSRSASLESRSNPDSARTASLADFAERSGMSLAETELIHAEISKFIQAENSLRKRALAYHAQAKLEKQLEDPSVVRGFTAERKQLVQDSIAQLRIRLGLSAFDRLDKWIQSSYATGVKAWK